MVDEIVRIVGFENFPSSHVGQPVVLYEYGGRAAIPRMYKPSPDSIHDRLVVPRASVIRM